MIVDLNKLLAVQDVAYGWNRTVNAIYLAVWRKRLTPVFNKGHAPLFLLDDVENVFGKCTRREWVKQFSDSGQQVDTDDLMMVSEVAEYHGKSRNAVYIAISQGKLKSVFRGNSMLFLRSDVEAMKWGKAGRPVRRPVSGYK